MKFSVIIVTRNRKEEMRQTIGAFQKQDYPDKEIIVIDNASTDGTDEMIIENFPDVRYYYLSDNFDIRSINLGIQYSSGDIIWRTDSDSYPENSDTFRRVAEIFEKYREISIIATEDIEVRANNSVWNWYPLKVDKNKIPDDGYPSHAFHGTGAAIKKEVFDKIGGFWEYGFEEMDFSTRAIAADFKIRYFPDIRTLHYASPIERDNSDNWVKISRQYMRYIWNYFPFFKAIGRSFLHFNFQIILGIIGHIKFAALLEGILSMIAVIFYTIRKERNVLSNEKLEEATLGVSYLSVISNYIFEILKKKLNKWKKS